MESWPGDLSCLLSKDSIHTLFAKDLKTKDTWIDILIKVHTISCLLIFSVSGQLHYSLPEKISPKNQYFPDVVVQSTGSEC